MGVPITSVYSRYLLEEGAVLMPTKGSQNVITSLP
jgi:hypothetical protein